MQLITLSISLCGKILADLQELQEGEKKPVQMIDIH